MRQAEFFDLFAESREYPKHHPSKKLPNHRSFNPALTKIIHCPESEVAI
jgi:hypothetical protein